MDNQQPRAQPCLGCEVDEPVLGERHILGIDRSDVDARDLPLLHGELGIDGQVHMLLAQPGFQADDLVLHRPVANLHIQKEQQPIVTGEFGVLVEHFGRGVLKIAAVGLRLALRDRGDHLKGKNDRMGRIRFFVFSGLSAQLLEQTTHIVLAEDPHVRVSRKSIEGEYAVLGEKPVRGGCLLLCRFRLQIEPRRLDLGTLIAL